MSSLGLNLQPYIEGTAKKKKYRKHLYQNLYQNERVRRIAAEKPQ